MPRVLHAGPLPAILKGNLRIKSVFRERGRDVELRISPKGPGVLARFDTSSRWRSSRTTSSSCFVSASMLWMFSLSIVDTRLSWSSNALWYLSRRPGPAYIKANSSNLAALTASMFFSDVCSGFRWRICSWSRDTVYGRWICGLNKKEGKNVELQLPVFAKTSFICLNSMTWSTYFPIWIQSPYNIFPAKLRCVKHDVISPRVTLYRQVRRLYKHILHNA